MVGSRGGVGPELLGRTLFRRAKPPPSDILGEGIIGCDQRARCVSQVARRLAPDVVRLTPTARCQLGENMSPTPESN